MALPGSTRIYPLGDHAVTVEFADTLSREANNAAVSLSDYFNANPFPGFIEAAPAIASATIFYRPGVKYGDRTDRITSFKTVRKLIRNALPRISEPSAAEHTVVTIPVSFAAEDALDLQAVADWAKLDRDEVIEIFLIRTYRVYMLGFLPGFAYMGEVDDRIAVPRHSTPRRSVPKGSVGIAGLQTGIYPTESPGGWQIIGRTSGEMITDDPLRPCILAPGDEVKFIRE